MGRLIDEKDLIKLYDENDRLWWGSALDDIQNLPTVEAIPKADYEARLKADMVAMLSEIQLEIEEKDADLRYCGHNLMAVDCIDIIQQKIDKLKAESEGEE